MDVVPTVVKQLGITNDWKLRRQAGGRAAHRQRCCASATAARRSSVGVPAQRFLAERKRYLARQLRAVPLRLDVDLAPGPRNDLLGSSVASRAATQAAGGGRIDNARCTGAVRPRSGVVPAYVTGTLSGVAAGTDVAVAVDGRVRGTGKAYKDGGDVRFSVLVPPETLRRGANRVEVFAVRGGGNRLVATSG